MSRIERDLVARLTRTECTVHIQFNKLIIVLLALAFSFWAGQQYQSYKLNLQEYCNADTSACWMESDNF